MRKLALVSLGVALAVTLAVLTVPDPPPMPVTPPLSPLPISPIATGPFAPPNPAAPSGADLEQSFCLPNKGSSLSHAPAVVFTADGKRLIMATADDEIAVFEAGSRKLLKQIKFPEAGTDGVSIDASGRYAAWALAKGGVAVMELEGEKIVARDDRLPAKWLAVSPDARFVAVASGASIEVRTLGSLRLVRKLEGHAAEVTNVGWSADGKLLGATARDGRLLVWGGGEIAYEAKKAVPLFAIAFRPDGGAVAYGGQDNQVYQYEFGPAREEVISKDQPYWITCLGYSPDGEMIAVGDESCDIWLYRVKTKQMTFHNKHHVECWLNSVAWAPDNETFLYGCRPNTHAGRPSIYEPLARAEAARSANARASRDRLRRAFEKTIAEEADPKKREALERSLAALSQEERPDAAVGFVADHTVQLAASPVYLDGASFGPILSDPAPAAELPAEIRRLFEEHQKTLATETERLKTDYCANTWRVRR